MLENLLMLKQKVLLLVHPADITSSKKKKRKKKVKTSKTKFVSDIVMVAE